jgi:hypothetical protein
MSPEDQELISRATEVFKDKMKTVKFNVNPHPGFSSLTTRRHMFTWGWWHPGGGEYSAQAADKLIKHVKGVQDATREDQAYGTTWYRGLTVAN